MSSAHLHQGSSDRTVHAVTEDGAQVVRYDRASKWYVEWPAERLIPRRAVSLQEAVRLGCVPGAVLCLGRPGGRSFDARVRTRLAAQREAPEGGERGPGESNV